jgi:acetyl esterase/lipase
MQKPDYTGVEKNTREFLEKLLLSKGPPLYKVSPEQARGVLSGLQAGNIQKLPADVETRTITGGSIGEVSFSIVRPPNSGDRALSVVMYFHGGGWVLGGADTHDRLIRELSNGMDAALVFVNYTPSPEAKYPLPIEQAYAATKWIKEKGQTINLDPSHLAVAGDSVGGNMAAATTLLAKKRDGELGIDYQLLFYPVTDANFDTASYNAFQDGYFLTREAMKWFWNNYTTSQTNRKEPTVSPLQASVDELRDLPPALIINGEFDVLRDEGEAFAHKLIDARVEVKGVRYHGTIHDFVMLNPISNTPAARGAIEQACYILKKILSNQ